VKLLRWGAGGLVWLVAGVVAALGVLLSVTVVLLPLGVPLLMLARRLFGMSVRLFLPRAVVHPVKQLQRRTVTGRSRVLGGRRPTLRKKMRKRVRRLRRQLGTSSAVIASVPDRSDIAAAG
jgi:hypothetical protein